MLHYKLPNLLNMIAVHRHHFLVAFFITVALEIKVRTKIAPSVSSSHIIPSVYRIEPGRNIPQWHDPCCVRSTFVQLIKILDLGKYASFFPHLIHLAENIVIATLAENIVGCVDMPFKAMATCPLPPSATPMTSFEARVREYF